MRLPVRSRRQVATFKHFSTHTAKILSVGANLLRQIAPCDPTQIASRSFVIQSKYEIYKPCSIYNLFWDSSYRAFQKHNWLEAGLFLTLGILSFWADFR